MVVIPKELGIRLIFWLTCVNQVILADKIFVCKKNEEYHIHPEIAQEVFDVIPVTEDLKHELWNYF